jgi:hypothetical protein
MTGTFTLMTGTFALMTGTFALMTGTFILMTGTFKGLHRFFCALTSGQLPKSSRFVCKSSGQSS